jgi:hypothetical protein
MDDMARSLFERYGLLVSSPSAKQEADNVRALHAELARRSHDLVLHTSRVLERTPGVNPRDVLGIQGMEQSVQAGIENIRVPLGRCLLHVESKEVNMQLLVANGLLPELMRAPDVTPYFAHNTVSGETTFLVRAENPDVPPLDPATSARDPLPPFLQVQQHVPRRVNLV